MSPALAAIEQAGLALAMCAAAALLAGVELAVVFVALDLSIWAAAAVPGALAAYAGTVGLGYAVGLRACRMLRHRGRLPRGPWSQPELAAVLVLAAASALMSGIVELGLVALTMPLWGMSVLGLSAGGWLAAVAAGQQAGFPGAVMTVGRMWREARAEAWAASISQDVSR